MPHIPANVFPLPSVEERASEWRVTYFKAEGNGFYHYAALVFDYDNGLTAREAWLSFINSSDEPALLHECVCTALNPWPYPEGHTRESA